MDCFRRILYEYTQSQQSKNGKMSTCNWLDLETLARILTDCVKKYPWTLLCCRALVAMDLWRLCTLIHWEDDNTLNCLYRLHIFIYK